MKRNRIIYTHKKKIKKNTSCQFNSIKMCTYCIKCYYNLPKIFISFDIISSGWVLSGTGTWFAYIEYYIFYT
jgi:hypothetical protein